jgi:hypothetical protein
MTAAPSPHAVLPRESALLLLRTALAVGEWRYARRTALAWLAAYPGDLQIGLLHARALVLEKAAPARQSRDHPSPEATHILESLCQADPEFLEAQQLLAQLRRAAGHELAEHSAGCMFALEGRLIHHAVGQTPAPAWALQLSAARQSYHQARPYTSHHLEQAEKLIHQVLCDLPSSDPAIPLTGITHLQVFRARQDFPPLALQSLAHTYHEKWPNCLQFTLLLADSLMDSGQDDQAVALLHQAVAQDIAGEVPSRLWGPDHPYRALWPAVIGIPPTHPGCPQEIPIPAAVAAALGWNQLPPTVPEIAGRVSTPSAGPYPPLEPAPSTSPPLPLPLEESIPSAPSERTVSHQSALPPPPGGQKTASPGQGCPPRSARPTATRDGCFPIYLILTTRQGLQTQYGAEALPVLDQAMQQLAKAIRRHQFGYQHWGAQVFYADVPEETARYGLRPAPHKDPWRLKLLLADLDQALAQRGEKIGALLIVGGPQVVPFHHLPNPVEDDYPSPSTTHAPAQTTSPPMAGRPLAGGAARPKFAHAHNQPPCRPARPRPMLVAKLRLARPTHLPSSFATPAIWRRAFSVFRAIGEPRTLLVSPPVQACEIPATTFRPPAKSQPRSTASQHPSIVSHHPPVHLAPAFFNDIPSPAAACLTLPPARLAYFNLHGLPDAIEWYGQRDPTEPTAAPDYPIALRPQDIRNSGHAPQVIFSEACYGAHILDKRVEEAISLKFLEAGSQAVVGSTCISYGSISVPLVAADLLGRLFWNFLGEGWPVGEALRRAKLYLAHEMHRRQGYLDSEDQKTLISFVLYGDPLAQPFPGRRAAKNGAPPANLFMPVRAACDRHTEEAGAPISPQVLARVRQVVSHYLPGMTDASITVSHERPPCQGCQLGGSCPAQPANERLAPAGRNMSATKARPGSGTIPPHQVITLSKRIEQAAIVHKQYARLRLDPAGKLVKLVVSR